MVIIRLWLWGTDTRTSRGRIKVRLARGSTGTEPLWIRTTSTNMFTSRWNLGTSGSKQMMLPDSSGPNSLSHVPGGSSPPPRIPLHPPLTTYLFRPSVPVSGKSEGPDSQCNHTCILFRIHLVACLADPHDSPLAFSSQRLPSTLSEVVWVDIDCLAHHMKNRNLANRRVRRTRPSTSFNSKSL